LVAKDVDVGLFGRRRRANTNDWCTNYDDPVYEKMTQALLAALTARALERGETPLSFGRVFYAGPFDRAFAAEAGEREHPTAALLGVTDTYILVALAKQPDSVLGTPLEFIHEVQMNETEKGSTMTLVTRGQPLGYALGPSGQIVSWIAFGPDTVLRDRIVEHLPK
jgi:hypothetical protein